MDYVDREGTDPFRSRVSLLVGIDLESQKKVHFYQLVVVDMANLATTPSSSDDGLVARLAISTNMLHKPDGPQFDAGHC